MRVVELTQVFRQKDEHFVALLNQIRDGRVSEACLSELNSRVCEVPRREAHTWLWVCTTNANAAAINRRFLSELPGPSRTYEATLSGDFEHKSTFDNDGARLPAEKVLALKEGARVIFIRNDRYRRWVNGTTGVVTRLDESEIEVKTDGGETHSVTVETWSKYKRVKVEDEVRDVEVGSMGQLPVRLGWAITIHKSQGMTLERVFFNAPQRLFASGQAYVGLSRARSLEGLRLVRPLHRSEVFLSSDAVEYRHLFKPLTF